MADSELSPLAKLWQTMSADQTVDQQRLANGANQLVFGEGPTPAELMLIGEAPGQNEDRLGRPFVGRAGQLLDQTLEAVGLSRAKIYITNLVKYRPANNRDPLPEEIAAAQSYLKSELAIVKPRLIGCLGRHAARHFYPDISMGRDNGRLIKIKTDITEAGELEIIPCYHPAACLYNPQLHQPFEAALKNIKAWLNQNLRPEPKRVTQTQLI